MLNDGGKARSITLKHPRRGEWRRASVWTAALPERAEETPLAVRSQYSTDAQGVREIVFYPWELTFLEWREG